MARPKKEIDEATVFKLAQIGCTLEEMGDWFGCSQDTLERRFADVIKEGKAQLKQSLRRAQVKKAMEGNPTMLIWLGKVLLQQKDTASMFTVSKEDSKLVIDLSGGASDGTTPNKTDSN